MKSRIANIDCLSAVILIITGSIAKSMNTISVRGILAILLGIAGLFVIVCIPHNLRVRRVRKAFRSLPKTVKQQVLDWIEQAASHSESITYLLLDNESPSSEPETAICSHVGGVPYAERGESWPVHGTSDPPRFLLQVHLVEPSLGEPWQGRLITVFLVFDAEQVVRSYADPSLGKYVPISPPVPPLAYARLESLRWPVVSHDDPIPMSPAQICYIIPEIKTLLNPFTTDYEGLLSQILRPSIYGYSLEAPAIAYQGGSPMHIQNPHDPECDHCQKRMRFLFQFGEIIPGLQLADGGVGYVYGCDDHPDHCKGFIDSH